MEWVERELRLIDRTVGNKQDSSQATGEAESAKTVDITLCSEEDSKEKRLLPSAN